MGFLGVSAAVRQKVCMHAIGATTSGQARGLHGDAGRSHAHGYRFGCALVQPVAWHMKCGAAVVIHASKGLALVSVSRHHARIPCLCFLSGYKAAWRMKQANSQSQPKTLFEIAMALLTISVSFPSKSRFSATFSILLRFGGSWNPTNCEKFNADGSLMGRTNLDKSVW